LKRQAESFLSAKGTADMLAKLKPFARDSSAQESFAKIEVQDLLPYADIYRIKHSNYKLTEDRMI
jgi:hypothetical protein